MERQQNVEIIPNESKLIGLGGLRKENEEESHEEREEEEHGD